ncbi:MAG: DUF6398 domain-containing protein [Bacteroidales bacterium]|jgi:hypothetical protein|nr:DUF6398 domain-containing protein [Bacteroidales bacterium]
MDTKQVKKEKEQMLIKLVSDFCQDKLNEEYKTLCVELVQKLGRKRTVPFITGKLEIWAASIIYTIGSLNFLFDRSFEPYIPSSDIHEYFETKSSTVSAKSKTIRDLLKLNRFDNKFSTNLMIENNPFNQYVMVDDLIVPIDSLPEEYQQMIKEARSKGEDISFQING